MSTFESHDTCCAMTPKMFLVMIWLMWPITGDIEIIMPEILLSLRADVRGNILKKLFNAFSRDSSLRKGNFKKPSFVFTIIPNPSSSRHGSQILLVLWATNPDLRKDFLTKSACISAVALSLTILFPLSINMAILTPLDLHSFTRVLHSFVNAYGAGNMPKGKTVQQKYFVTPSTSQENPRNNWCVGKMSMWWYPLQRSNLNL